MRTCPQCQSEILNPEAKFCTKCGATITAIEDTLIPLEDNVTQSYLKKQSLLFYIVLVLLLALIAACCWGYYQGYFLDSEAPQVLIKSPNNNKQVLLDNPGASVKETVEIAANDNKGLKLIELYVNNTIVKQFSKDDIYIYKWETNSTGKYTFQAYAYDNNGNKSVSEPVTITAVKGNNEAHLEDKIKAVTTKEVITKKVSADEDKKDTIIPDNHPGEDKKDIIISDNHPDDEIKSIEMTITAHYSNIPDDLPKAYSYFSQGLQNKVSFAEWSKGYSNTLYDTVNNVTVTEISGSYAVAEISMVSRDSTASGSILVQNWGGCWELIKEGGQWKLNVPKTKKISAYYE